jgi:hypothetical protein
MPQEPTTSNRRKSNAEEETSQRLITDAGQSGLVAFKLVVSHGNGHYELVDHAGILPLELILDLRSQDAALNPSWIERYFLKMVLVPLVTSYLSEKTASSCDMILQAYEYDFCANEILFLSTDYHELSNKNAIAQYLRHSASENLHKSRATLLYFSLAGSARSTFFTPLESGGGVEGHVALSPAPPHGVSGEGLSRAKSLTDCNCSPRSTFFSRHEAGGGREGQASASKAPPTGASGECSPRAESLADCVCHKCPTFYGVEVGPDQLEELFIFPSAPPDSVELNDTFKSEEFKSFVNQAEIKNKTAKKRKTKEQIKNKCYAKFLARMFFDLLRNGQIQAKNRSGVLLPLRPKDDSAYLFCTNPDYTSSTSYYTFRMTKHSKSDPLDTFQITIQFCPKCERFISIVWNRQFEPVLAEEEFDTPFDLWSLKTTLLNSVERDLSFIEHFHDLPEMDDGLPITFERTKWLLDRAEFWFLRDDAHKELNAPVALLGDVHGEITTVQKVYDLAVTNRKVSQWNSKSCNIPFRFAHTFDSIYADTPRTTRRHLRQR